MLKKYAIAITITISLLLLLIATMVYPGGSRFNKNSVGFQWRENYISNLFGTRAVNGAKNASQLWAILSMLFLSASFGLFFYDFSKRIASATSRNIIRYGGMGSVLFGFLAVTPYHDTMVTISDVFSLVSIFYITIFVFTSKLHVHKVLCCLFLLSLYFLTFIYYSGSFPHALASIQKINLAISITWMLSLQYFSGTDSFKPVPKKIRHKIV